MSLEGNSPRNGCAVHPFGLRKPPHPDILPQSKTVIALTALSLATFSACRPALAGSDLLGLYIGAGIGQATVRDETFGFDSHHAGWQVFLGVRPVPLLGVELEYTDFGHPHVSYLRPGVSQISIDASQRAPSVFAVGYLPLPLSWLDIYGKAGLSRLQMTLTKDVQCYGVYATCVRSPLYDDRTQTDFGYGAGIQVKFGTTAFRAEYERIRASTGDPDLLSIGVTWSFL
jgi:opacity protein-like surface antigen